jgi:hypothetical protein
MKKNYFVFSSLFFVATSLFLSFQSKAAFVTVPLTGFNADVVANGIGSPVSSTDSTFDAAGWYLLDSTYRYTVGGVAPLRALSPSGLINSVATAGLSFQLAPYTAANSLRLAVNNSPRTLNFVTPLPASQVYVLGATGSGQGTITITVNFTDATSQTFTSQSLADWFGGIGFAIQGIGRVNPQNSQPTLPDAALNPRLYQKTLNLSAANFTKLISGITVTQTSVTAGVINIMAVSIATPPLGFATDLTASGRIGKIFPNPVTGDFFVELEGSMLFATEKINCKIYTVTGKLASLVLATLVDENRIHIQPAVQLASGIYILETEDKGKTSFLKFVVN